MSLPCQEPDVVIQLYNNVVAYLADVVSSERLVGISWPPPEFSFPEIRELVPHLDWNSPQHLAWLKRAILSLQIPEWEWPPQNGMSANFLNCKSQIVGDFVPWVFVECTDVYTL